MLSLFYANISPKPGPNQSQETKRERGQVKDDEKLCVNR